MHGRGGGAGAKTAPQEMGPTPNLPRPLRNRVLQTIIVLKKWQIRPRPLRVCVNIPAEAEREYQSPPASAPQPLHACVNVAKDDDENENHDYHHVDNNDNDENDKNNIELMITESGLHLWNMTIQST